LASMGKTGGFTGRRMFQYTADELRI
jgi:hypothetical protein